LKRGFSYIWVQCPECLKERWSRYSKKHSSQYRICSPCNARKMSSVRFHKQNAKWKGGRYECKRDGYIYICLPPDSPYLSMCTHHHYLGEHRLVMAQHLDRCLESWETVHHKGMMYPKGSIENRQDNRIENLELLPGVIHDSLERAIREVEKLKTKVVELESQAPLIRQDERGKVYQDLIGIMRNSPDLRSLEREMSVALEALKATIEKGGGG